MSSKNYIDVIIDGKIYNIGGFESEAYLQKVASYINNMIAEFKQNENYRVQKVDMQRILLEINIANANPPHNSAARFLYSRESVSIPRYTHGLL